jgi:type II secretory pathway component PulJ
MKLSHRRSAFTLTELMISAAIGVLAIAAAFSGAISLQRCLIAGEEFGADKTEQTRLSDYLARDLRRAQTIQGPVGNVILTLTLPGYYDADGNPITPKVVKTADSTYAATYDPTPVTVVYRKFNSTITRTENANTPVVIATNVADFECPVDNIGADKFVHTRITFAPSFQHKGTSTTAGRTATTVYNTIHLRNKR